MHRVLPVLLLLGLAGCHRGVRFDQQVLTKPGVRYRVGELSPGWERVKVSSNDLAWFVEDTGHALQVNSTCKGHEDAPLDVLTRHLLMGFTDRHEVETQQVVVDEREALRSRFVARMDGVPVDLLFVVLKKDNCVYDFSYVSPLGRFEERLVDFESLVHGFHAESAS
ncbi:MAG TPA: hypothetical protein VF794_25820 [Archangium sp.]|jgi:hypothetical protein|uniref:hypothetical protein n=1 Tax=Archangium sp. TaxID=1872627 RepID=UPI002EDB9B24